MVGYLTKFNVKKIQKSKLKSMIIILLTLSMPSMINIGDNFSNADQEDEQLNTIEPMSPRYKYHYENDFDLWHHVAALDPFGKNYGAIKIGYDTEWSQDPDDDLSLDLRFYNEDFPGSLFQYSMTGVLAVVSHNTFTKQNDDALGAYVDFHIDIDLLNNDNPDHTEVRSLEIALAIMKPNLVPTTLIQIHDKSPQIGRFYIPNFDQYIWPDGKIYFNLGAQIQGFADLFEEAGLNLLLKFEGLGVVQEIVRKGKIAENRTLILVHGYSILELNEDPHNWVKFILAPEFREAYNNIIVISYYGQFGAIRYSKDTAGVWTRTVWARDHQSIDDLITRFWSIAFIADILRDYIKADYANIEENVDFICHSMGGLVTRYMIKHWYLDIQEYYISKGKVFNIKNVAGLGVPNHGSIIDLTVDKQTEQMKKNSDFLTELNRYDETPFQPDINWYTYRSGLNKGWPASDGDLRHDGLVGVDSVPLDRWLIDQSTNKGWYQLDHETLRRNDMLKTVIFNDLIKPPAIIDEIFDEKAPGEIFPDTTLPTITITSPTDGLVTNQDVTLTYTVSDDISDISDIEIIGPVSDTTYSSEGPYDITLTATDEAGNSVTVAVSFIIDKTPPDINFLEPPEGYYNTDQTVSWEVYDDNLDASTITSSHPNPTTFSSEGAHTVTVTAIDLAGNIASKSLLIVIDKTAPVIMITGPTAGYYNTDQTVSWTVSDPYIDDVSSTHDTPTIFTEDGTYQVTVSVDDLAGNFAEASSAEFVIDKTLPETLLNVGNPQFLISGKVHLTPTTLIELIASDLSGVSETLYKVTGDGVDSGWITYDDIFSLDSLGVEDGEYVLHYFSTDIAGNSEGIHLQPLVLDSSPPTLNWAYEGYALQDGFLFEIDLSDDTGVDDSSIVISIRELNGPIVATITGQYANGLWQADEIFDTTTLPDGYYEIVVDASDAFGFPTTEVFSFSIRNWEVLVLLPSTESNKAGRTMPVKFALRVVEAVDPSMPFVIYQELDIFITDTATGEILQHSTYGDSSKDYRINEESEHYITNFKTHKTPTTYLVSIYLKDFPIAEFTFTTDRSIPKIKHSGIYWFGTTYSNRDWYSIDRLGNIFFNRFV